MPPRAHLAAGLCASAVVAAALLGVDAIAAHSPGEGVVWMLTAGSGSEALASLAGTDGARIVGVHADGHAVQVRVDSLQATSSWAFPSGWLLRLPSAELAWPGCG
jgi:hypothetical protein